MTVSKRFAVAWLFLALIFGIGLAQINIPFFLKLAMHGERASATIVEPNCKNHNSASYTFNVGSARYSTSGIMAVDCSSLRSGDSISIYYDKTEPNRSSTQEPLSGIANELITIGFVCLIFPPAIIGALKRGLSRD
jgi:hypothetical protein